MTTQILASYRASMFDGLPGLNWLRPGWRGLRLYGRKAKIAIIDGNMLEKANMIRRADELLNLLTGILETDSGSTLGPALMNIYAALRQTLLRANLNDDLVALDEYDEALSILDRQMTERLESEAAA
ncbi:MAG: flagellar biosynthesis protein FliS [Acidocella sp. 20-57-95]|nr:MAG: flagellar biosynthesis protein FliS [Acidocella sp. 20-57-95]OYV56024.1 MAG: flagellar biosynthesis protein FliS [Acidocella sp. 21-58-7]HQT63548.1 flagellar protein FliS [Acidocella sp.]